MFFNLIKIPRLYIIQRQTTHIHLAYLTLWRHSVIRIYQDRSKKNLQSTKGALFHSDQPCIVFPFFNFPHILLKLERNFVVQN